MTTAWKRRCSVTQQCFWSVPEDALALYALEHAAPSWPEFDAWASKCRGRTDVRIDVYESTMTAVLDGIRERARESRWLREAADQVRLEIEARAEMKRRGRAS